MYFLSIYKEEIENLFGEIKKMALEVEVPSAHSERALRKAQDKLTDNGVEVSLNSNPLPFCRGFL